MEGFWCVNFIIGVGGLFQVVVFGYGGFCLIDDYLEVFMFGILGIFVWVMNDLKYRGFMFDLRLVDIVVLVNVFEFEDVNRILIMVLQDGYFYLLQIGRVREMLNKVFWLRVMNMSDVRVYSGGQFVIGDILRKWILFVVLMIINLLCLVVVYNVLY